MSLAEYSESSRAGNGRRVSDSALAGLAGDFDPAFTDPDFSDSDFSELGPNRSFMLCSQI
jgi:hypothetical protein